MVNFFVRENPLLNHSDSEDSVLDDNAPNFVPAKEAPTMLDYEDFGFPDSQVVHEWTIVGCLTAVFCTFSLIVGLLILGYICWNIYSEQHQTKPMIQTNSVELPVTGKGMTREGTKAFTIDCMWNYPNAMCITPDGRYLITVGGPRTRSDDSEKTASFMEKAPQAPEWETGIDETRSFAEVPDVKILSYDSRPADPPVNPYNDFLNLGKNGIRIVETIKEKPQLDSDFSLRPSVSDGEGIAYDDTFSSVALPSLAELEAQHNAREEKSVWKRTRPSVESYPIAFWSMETMEPEVVLWNHEYPISAIAVSPDGKKVVSADKGGNVILWSLDNLPGENGIEVPTWHFFNKIQPSLRTLQRMGKVHAVNALTFTPSGRQFVMAATVDALDESGNRYTNCGALILWDVENWCEILRKRGTGDLLSKVDTYYQTFQPVGKFTDVQYTPNGKYLIAAAAGSNAGIYYFDNRTNNPGYGTCMADLNSNEQRPRSGYTSEFKPNLVQGVSHHDFPNADMVSFAISPESSETKSGNSALTIVSADNLGRIAFWSFAPKTNRPRDGVTCAGYWSSTNSENTTRNIRKVLYSRDKKMVFLFGDDTLVYKGNIPYECIGVLRNSDLSKNGKEKLEFSLVSGFFTEDNKYFLAGCDDCQVRIWNLDDVPVEYRFQTGRVVGKDSQEAEDAIQKELSSVILSGGGPKTSGDDDDEDDD